MDFTQKELGRALTKEESVSQFNVLVLLVARHKRHFGSSLVQYDVHMQLIQFFKSCTKLNQTLISGLKLWQSKIHL